MSASIRVGDMVASVNPRGLIGIVTRIVLHPGHHTDTVSIMWLNYGVCLSTASARLVEVTYDMERALQRRKRWLDITHDEDASG